MSALDTCLNRRMTASDDALPRSDAPEVHPIPCTRSPGVATGPLKQTAG
jgi:hypothetical protein